MKKVLVIAVVAVIGVVGWRVHARHHAQDRDKNVLLDRLWLDHVPGHEREPFNVLALLSEQHVGVVQNMTAYRGSYELFRFTRDGWKYPQTGDTDRPSIRVRRCSENGMDFCLDITGNSRGVHHYYSRKDWVIDSLAGEQALVDQLSARP